ncbi:hypothetical protein HHX47_DHR4000380 [Lentinula edodes]|nr:hypothetical protein HHX47_DHR4000380 [Lentinula edodes]
MSHYHNVSTRPEELELSPSPQPQDFSEHLVDSMYRDHPSTAHFDNFSKERLSSQGFSAKFTSQTSRTKKLIVTSIVALVVIIVAVTVPVYLVTTRHSSSSTGSQSPGSSSQVATSGISGSLIEMEDGTNFTYMNSLGGDWAADPTQPFLPGGKAQSWSPRVGADEWIWGENVARGVNLGGWLVTEPFIVPSLYEKYVNNSQNITVLDEWTLSLAMGLDLASEMGHHYETFITEQDFAEIAAAGLNWVRIPIGFWAIEAINDEPFLVGTSWTYFLKAIQWARKYGIRIYLDLHALPGSQNGWPAIWEGFLSGADRLALDQHPYLAFMGDTSSVDAMATKPCEWAIATNQSSKAFGITLGGEFSTAINDCGLWLNGIGPGSSNPECPMWDDWASYNASTIASLKQVTLATMDALQNFFFWTWKIGNSTVLGTSSSPLWHYKLGLQQGWVPSDPREAVGHCESVLSSSEIFDGSYPVTATGGAGAGTVLPAQTSSHVFPPPSLAPSFAETQMTLLPTYTPTGTVKTLFAPIFTSAPSANVGTGWNNTADTSSAYVMFVSRLMGRR